MDGDVFVSLLSSELSPTTSGDHVKLVGGEFAKQRA